MNTGLESFKGEPIAHLALAIYFKDPYLGLKGTAGANSPSCPLILGVKFIPFSSEGASIFTSTVNSQDTHTSMRAPSSLTGDAQSGI